MRRMHLVLFMATLLVWTAVRPVLAQPSTVTVKKATTYPTIQSGINAVAVGGTVIVEPDTYVENINFNGKNITLRSTDPNDRNVVKSTIIDGGGVNTVVSFSGAENASCMSAWRRSRSLDHNHYYSRQCY